MAFSGTVPNDQRDVDIWIGTPPGGIHLCKLTTRGMSQVKDRGEVVIPDCADPQVTHIRSFVTGKAATIVAAGMLEPEHRAALQNAFDIDIAQTMSFQIGTSPPHGGYYTGPFILSRFDISGEEDEDSKRVQCEV